MKEQKETPKFANLQYSVLHELEISIAEYWYLNMVYYLSRDGWCYKSLSSIATDMRMTKVGVIRLRDRLLDRGFLEKNRKGHVKTTVTYNKVYLSESKSVYKVTNRYTKYNAIGIQSSTKNNSKNYKEIEIVKNGEGYKKARAIADRLKTSMSLTKGSV